MFAPSRFRRSNLMSLLALTTSLAAGCSSETSATSAPPPQAAIRGKLARKNPVASAVSVAAKISAQGHPKETWDVLYLAGVKVGYCRTKQSDLVEDGKKLVRIDTTNLVSLHRAGERTEHTIAATHIETPAGELVRFHMRLHSGATPTDFAGHVEGNELVVKTETAGKTTVTRLAWPAGAGGMLAAEQSLLRQPMRPGERRTLNGLMAVVNQPVAMELVADKIEPTKLLQHSEDLLRVECRAKLPDGQPIVERLWVNRDGVVLKRQIDALRQETYRSSKEIALADIGPPKFDLMLDTTVPTARPLDNPHATRRVRYRVHLKTSDPAQVFSRGRTQEIESLDPRTAEVIVRAMRPQSDGNRRGLHDDANRPAQTDGLTSRAPPAITSVPTDDDRRPNNLIQSDNPKIIAMARSIGPTATDPWEISTLLETAVKRHIRRSNYQQSFASAADVVENGEGDCTEHAVLLAALCRARGIPARVAIGLVYISAAQGFGYHMWNEVWIDGAWIPLDATIASGGVGAAHLKLADSNLDGTSAFSTFLSVAQVIGQLRIEILEVE
jgi:hypothetical protein